MRKEYEIQIKQVLSRVQTIESESIDDAINKAMELYYSEEIVLDANDMKEVAFEEYKDNVR